MPYRRRRPRYVRPRGRKLMWIRNAATLTNQLSAATVWAVDMLAPLHTGDAVMKVGGQYSTAPSSTGCTVMRAHLTVIANFQNDTGVLQWNDGALVAAKVMPWMWDTVDHEYTVGTDTDFSPVQGANTEDWCLWRNLAASTDSLEQTVTTIHSATSSHDLDIKAKRKLEDLGDSLVFFWQYTGAGAGAHEVQLYSSTLLALP